jgi:hypothetical protein
VALKLQEGLIMPMNVPTVDETHGHDHFHGTLDPALLTSEKGIWAVKWSMVGLLLTALLQGAVVAVTSSIALLLDTIHNAGGAATALRMDCAFDGPEETEQAI